MIDDGADFKKISETEINGRIHVYTGLLKQWLRDLKEPPIPLDMFEDFISISSNIYINLFRNRRHRKKI
jgi:hypothetical protein